MTDLLTRLLGIVQTLHAIEMLEFHDKNHLYFGTDPCKLSREKQELFESAMSCIKLLQSESKKDPK